MNINAVLELLPWAAWHPLTGSRSTWCSLDIHWFRFALLDSAWCSSTAPLTTPGRLLDGPPTAQRRFAGAPWCKMALAVLLGCHTDNLSIIAFKNIIFQWLGKSYKIGIQSNQIHNWKWALSFKIQMIQLTLKLNQLSSRLWQFELIHFDSNRCKDCTDRRDIG